MDKNKQITKIRNIAQKYSQALADKGVAVEKIILFGSGAKGKYHANSDIDFCVVSKNFGRDATSEMMTLKKIAVRVDDSIEPIPLNPNDFNDPYSTLVSEIKAYGKEMK